MTTKSAVSIVYFQIATEDIIFTWSLDEWFVANMSYLSVLGWVSYIKRSTNMPVCFAVAEFCWWDVFWCCYFVSSLKCFVLFGTWKKTVQSWIGSLVFGSKSVSYSVSMDIWLCWEQQQKFERCCCSDLEQSPERFVLSSISKRQFWCGLKTYLFSAGLLPVEPYD